MDKSEKKDVMRETQREIVSAIIFPKKDRTIPGGLDFIEQEGYVSRSE